MYREKWVDLWSSLMVELTGWALGQWETCVPADKEGSVWEMIVNVLWPSHVYHICAWCIYTPAIYLYTHTHTVKNSHMLKSPFLPLLSWLLLDLGLWSWSVASIVPNTQKWVLSRNYLTAHLDTLASTGSNSWSYLVVIHFYLGACSIVSSSWGLIFTQRSPVEMHFLTESLSFISETFFCYIMTAVWTWNSSWIC